METICHNHPNEAHGKKLYYYSNTNLFKCYTECDGAFDIFELLVKIKKIQNDVEWSLIDAVNYTVSYFNINDFEIKIERENETDDMKIINGYKAKESGEEIVFNYNIYDDTILQNLTFAIPKPWVRDGISIDTMQRYGIKYYGTDHKIVIPHYNIYNELIGIRGRALSQEESDRYGKYMPLSVNSVMYTHPLSANLYGLNQNLQNIKRMKKIIIFEGEKSVLLYDSVFGSDNNISVASCGSSISLYQLELIKRYCDVNEIIIAYDKQFKEIGDDEFKKDVKLLKKLASKIANDYTVSIVFDKDGLLDYKNSPIDKGRQIFEMLFQNRIVEGVS